MRRAATTLPSQAPPMMKPPTALQAPPSLSTPGTAPPPSLSTPGSSSSFGASAAPSLDVPAADTKPRSSSADTADEELDDSLRSSSSSSVSSMSELAKSANDTTPEAACSSAAASVPQLKSSVSSPHLSQDTITQPASLSVGTSMASGLSLASPRRGTENVHSTVSSHGSVTPRGNTVSFRTSHAHLSTQGKAYSEGGQGGSSYYDALQKIVDRRSSKQKLTHFNLIFKSKFSDLIIQVGGKPAYAHTFIVRIRAPTLLDMLLGSKKARLKKRKGRHFKLRILTADWSDSKVAKRARHFSLSHEIMLFCLEYLYNDEVNVHTLTPMTLYELFKFANHIELPRLARICYNRLKDPDTFNMENVFPLLQRLTAEKETVIREIVVNYIHKNIVQVLQNKESATILGIDLFHELSALALEKPKDLPPNEPLQESTFESDMEELYKQTHNHHGDAYWLDETNTETFFHKAILAGQSKSFENILLGANQSQDLTKVFNTTMDTLGIPLGRDRSNVIRHFLQYSYYRYAEVPVRVAVNLASFAGHYKMFALQNLCEKIFSSNITADTVLDTLRLTYLETNQGRSEMQELRRLALNFLTANISRVHLDILPELEPAILVEIIRTWKSAAREAEKAFDAADDDELPAAASK
mmetsp:Transcript_48791/g.122773  ORF Transcript_48791/g.122773 Transcript_48791/m.122773 type:complete len:642 (-) Transcript_48791:75-2000(-)